jgi:hypothetical protein
VTAFTYTLLNTYRSPWRAWALSFGMLLIGVLLASAPSAWVLIFIFPAFFASATLTVPPYSEFELSLPVTRSPLLWARMLTTTDLVWLPLLFGWYILQLFAQPFSQLRSAFECAVFFTGCICLATLARLATRPMIAWGSALLALACAILMLTCLPTFGVLAVTVAALVPIAARIWWTYVPEGAWFRPTPLTRLPMWPLVRILWSPKTLFHIAMACWFGFDRSFSLLPFSSFIFFPAFKPNRFVLPLPISRRLILLAALAPVIAAYFAGAALSIEPERIVDFTRQSGSPPGLLVPNWALRSFPISDVPPIVAPWGESSQPRVQTIAATFGGSEYLYNPYWVGPDNSPRFVEWQFGRATAAIYGRALTLEQLHTALLAGLRPITSQARLSIIRMGFGVAWLLTIAVIAAIERWTSARWARRLLPWLPFLGILVASLFLAAVWPYLIPSALLRLSALLPSNLILMTLLLLVPLACLYRLLETVFRYTEFPEKPKEIE